MAILEAKSIVVYIELSKVLNMQKHT